MSQWCCCGWVLALVWVGCSSGPSQPDAARGRASVAGGGGTLSTPAAGSGGTSTGQSNPTGGLLPTAPAPTPTGAAGEPGTPSLSSREPVVIDQCGAGNPANVAPADVDKLRAGGTPEMLKWLYPYAGTVFPRGMGAPLLMWEGPAADAVYLHVKARSFEYTGCLTPTAAGQLQFPQEIWDQAGRQTNGKGDDFALELATIASGTATGPVRSHFTIAQATIKGSIYYNSYTSAQNVLPGGVVLRIPAGGGAATLFVSTGCNGCHSVSADGSRLISQFSAIGGQSFALAVGGMANPPGNGAGPRGSFGALYPDGSKYLATSLVIDVARSFMTQGIGGPVDATLYDLGSGAAVPNMGIPTGALMPMFSPDGTRLVFNDFALGQAHGLALMTYDVATDTASDYRMLTQEEGALRPGWPFVLPDNGGVLYARTDSADFSGNGAGLGGAIGLPGGGAPPGGGLPGGGLPGGGLPGLTAPFSELALVDVASGKSTLLAQAMGYATPADAMNETTYLPFGAEELHHNYFPTLSPVAAGGYFWVFFDSVRHYGNLGLQRQLWGAAVEIQPGGSYALDPSKPAFYLPGQELGTGNHRAFAALDPCKRDGDACNSGIDCCGGFCYFDNVPEENVEPVGSCSPKMLACAKVDERCRVDADCCKEDTSGEPHRCIAGFCAEIPTLQ
ncbi:MAG: hypothetical protein ABW321_24290 [Polyangiales bacterium]